MKGKMTLTAPVECASTINNGTEILETRGLKPIGHKTRSVSYADMVRGNNPWRVRL